MGKRSATGADEEGIGSDAIDLGDPTLQCNLDLSVVAQWLLQHISSEHDAELLLKQIGERLCAQGVPIWRASYNVHTLHAEVFVRNIVWTYGQGCKATLISHFDIQLPIFKNSPVAAIYNGASPIRRKLAGKNAVIDFPICEELRSEGATDYLILPLSFSDGRRTYVSFTTKDPLGFTEEAVQTLVDLSPYISLRLELESSYFATSSLLQLYLGRKAAELVLAGEFKRGRGQSIDAAIWYCDLRDFTLHTSRNHSRVVVETLDLYFECVTNAVAQNGGEILKFVGDAVLAVFYFADDGPESACARAIMAADEFRTTLANSKLESENNDIPIRVGIALHTGSVFFGNVGGRQRLDFTVIGSAVNEVCRIEPLTKEHNVDLVVSDDFVREAGIVGQSAVSLGHHSLKGVDREVEVFTFPNKGQEAD